MARLSPTLTCCACHEKFPREQIIYYGSQQNQLKYCPSCYTEKRDREKFSNFVCELFGIKAPGPKLYSQRKKLKETYGFTDDTILQTLEYLFRVKHFNKGFESLGLVNPQSVDEAKRYFKKQKEELEKMKQAEEARVRDLIVPVKKKERKLDLLDINDYLEDE